MSEARAGVIFMKRKTEKRASKPEGKSRREKRERQRSKRLIQSLAFSVQNI